MPAQEGRGVWGCRKGGSNKTKKLKFPSFPVQHMWNLGIGMIKSLTLRNFRAFKNQRFEFGRFNVFVGPNNSGKSSALSALNMIAQTVLSSELNQTPLVLNGDFEELGTFMDMVHGGRTNTPVGIDLEFDQFEIRCEFKYRVQRREIEITRYELFESGKSIFFYSQKKDAFDLKFLGIYVEKLIPNRKIRPEFRNFSPVVGIYMLLVMRAQRDENSPMSEQTFNTIRRVDRIFSNARGKLRRAFQDFDSLSPFRVKPERTYLYSGETAQRIGTTGANTARLLSSDASKRGSESKGLQTAISRWFELSGIAKSLEIDSISPRHFEIVLVDFNGSRQNISDVGFGCSQVLPVLASALHVFSKVRSRNYPVLIVQEPEIHLHPNAQASLGSFFAGVVPLNGQLFIETHSDNLILRLARHVSDGTIDREEMKIFYVHKVESQSRVQCVGVSEEGYLSDQWPGGFFPQRQSESLALAQQSSSAKDRSRSEIQLMFELGTPKK